MTGITAGSMGLTRASRTHQHEDKLRAMGRRWAELWELARQQQRRLPSQMKFNSFTHSSIRQLEDLLGLDHMDF